MDKLLTPQELSQMLSVPLSTVYYWTHIEFIPHIKLGRYVRFESQNVMKWLSERQVKGRNTRKTSLYSISHRSRSQAYQEQPRGGQGLSVNKS